MDYSKAFVEIDELVRRSLITYNKYVIENKIKSLKSEISDYKELLKTAKTSKQDKNYQNLLYQNIDEKRKNKLTENIEYYRSLLTEVGKTKKIADRKLSEAFHLVLETRKTIDEYQNKIDLYEKKVAEKYNDSSSDLSELFASIDQNKNELYSIKGLLIKFSCDCDNAERESALLYAKEKHYLEIIRDLEDELKELNKKIDLKNTYFNKTESLLDQNTINDLETSITKLNNRVKLLSQDPVSLGSEIKDLIRLNGSPETISNMTKELTILSTGGFNLKDPLLKNTNNRITYKVLEKTEENEKAIREELETTEASLNEIERIIRDLLIYIRNEKITSKLLEESIQKLTVMMAEVQSSDEVAFNTLLEERAEFDDILNNINKLINSGLLELKQCLYQELLLNSILTLLNTKYSEITKGELLYKGDIVTNLQNGTLLEKISKINEDFTTAHKSRFNITTDEDFKPNEQETIPDEDEELKDYYEMLKVVDSHSRIGVSEEPKEEYTEPITKSYDGLINDISNIETSNEETFTTEIDEPIVETEEESSLEEPVFDSKAAASALKEELTTAYELPAEPVEEAKEEKTDNDLDKTQSIDISNRTFDNYDINSNIFD